MGGTFFDPLMDFIKTQAPNTDIFCFQEVLDCPAGNVVLKSKARANLFTEMASALPEFTGFFAPTQSDYDSVQHAPSLGLESGLATFVRKSHPIKKAGNFFIFRERNTFVPNDYGTLPHNCHYVQIETPSGLLTSCNVHGTSIPVEKRDSPGRIKQSEKILDFVQQELGEKIISGDFNLFPNIKSITMFEDAGFQNLIKDFNITTTRGSLLKKLHPEYATTTLGWMEFADYALATPGIKVKKFTVPDLPLSDHLPLIVEFTT